MRVRFYVRIDKAGLEIEKEIEDIGSYLGYSPDELFDELEIDEQNDELQFALRDWMNELIEFGYELLEN